ERTIRMHGGGLLEERFEIVLLVDLLLEFLLTVAGEPANDLVDFLLRAAFALGLLNVQRVDLCKRHRENVVLGHCCYSCVRGFDQQQTSTDSRPDKRLPSRKVYSAECGRRPAVDVGWVK